MNPLAQLGKTTLLPWGGRKGEGDGLQRPRAEDGRPPCHAVPAVDGPFLARGPPAGHRPGLFEGGSRRFHRSLCPRVVLTAMVADVLVLVICYCPVIMASGPRKTVAAAS